MTLRPPWRLRPIDTVAVIVGYAVVAGSVSLFSPVDPAMVNLALAGLIAVAVVVMVLRRPRVTLAAKGIVTNGRAVPWSNVTAIDDFSNIRSRYVRVFVADSKKWLRLPALTTGRLLPAPWYAETTRRIGDFTTMPVKQSRRGPAWVYPVVLALVLAIPVSTQDPVHYWLPRSEVDAAPDYCGIDPSPNRTVVDSLLVTRTKACQVETSGSLLVVQSLAYGRSGLVNGTGVAHHLYVRCTLPDVGDLGGQAPARPQLPGVGEVSAASYAPADMNDTAGVYLLARKANLVVFVVYSPDGIATPRWTCAHDTAYHFGGTPQNDFVLSSPDPAQLTVAVDIANQILDSVTPK